MTTESQWNCEYSELSVISGVIHKLRIQNYKSLHDVTVEFDPLTVLIGRSGSGKTNLVNAIRFLRDFLVRGQNFLQELNRENLWSQTISASVDNPSIAIDCSFWVPGILEPLDYAVEIGKRPRSGKVELLRESYSVNKNDVFKAGWGEEGDNFRWLQSPDIIDVPNIEQLKPPLLAAFPALEEAVIAHVALTRGIGCYDFPGNVLQPAPNAAPGPGNNGGFHDDGSNYLETMQAIVSNLGDLSVRKRIVAALRQLSPTLASIELDDHRHPTSAVVSHKFGSSGSRLGLRLAQESEGLRRFYAHLLAMNQVPAKQTLIFEEPEKGIYPGGLEVLAKELRNCAERGHSQVILTTHSPAFLDHFDPECIRVVEIESNSTKIGRVDRSQLEAVRSELLTAGELLTVDPARVEASTSG